MSLIHNDETKSANSEEETARETFHYILAIYTVWHEGYLYMEYLVILWTKMACFIKNMWLTGRECPFSSVVDPTLGGSTITSYIMPAAKRDEVSLIACFAGIINAHTTSDQKVGEQDKREHCHGGWHVYPCRLFYFKVGHL